MTEGSEVGAQRQPISKLCILLWQATHNLTTELTAGLEVLGLTARAHEVLAAAAAGEYSQIELARIIGLDKTTMVATLDELEAAGLIERRRSRTDRRAHIVTVTEAGKGKLLEAEKIVSGVHTEVLSVLPAEDRQVFLESLTRLVEGQLAKPATPIRKLRRRAPRASRAA